MTAPAAGPVSPDAVSPGPVSPDATLDTSPAVSAARPLDGSGGAGRPAGWRQAAAGLVACGWGGNQFTPLLLMYRRTDGYSTVTVDALLGAYVVGLIPGLLIGGPLSDRLGRRPLMIAGTAVSLLASAVLAAGSLGLVPLVAGRLLTGAAVGIAMAVGSSWVKELSQGPHDPGADPGAGARRSSLALTAGFGIGPGVAGALAQWGPWPTALPYLVHVAVGAVLLAVMLRAPETRQRTGAPGGLLADLKVPAAGHRRFLRVVLPLAPWVFGSAGIAYAVTPQLVDARVGHWGLAYATALTVLTLGTGALVQPFAKRLGARSTVLAMSAAMVLMALGMAVCALDAGTRSPWLAPVGALVLGAGYGIAIVSGLVEIQRIARPDDLAGLTGVYYAAAYAGFLLPTVLAAASSVVGYPAMLLALAVLAVGCLAVILANSRTGPGEPAAPGTAPVRRAG
ncbi:putative multidrug resistance transporter [Actinacidiphila reveromycinica]|uniref:Putative multidrug resistance transporter n=1 Tax=Actinacidiphila reveromycinica TaxID=659352 RepID=A0A7U3VN44_9ACTN|nr:MFS transporter [Streptomyces sp. SN-593]BBA97189.1 putative multidrug resistance transporter [Streptomyces sp. SN-593]